MINPIFIRSLGGKSMLIRDGDFGVGSLKAQNLALLSKLWLHLRSEKNSL